jgi:hypothetical protein
MEPTEAINALEVAFRELIHLIWGNDWIAKSKVDVPRLEAKLQEEQAKRRGATVSTDLLDYTEFTQLGSILLDNWNDFGPALGKRKYAEVYIDRLNGLRNAPMHSRVLLPFERELLAGIVGEFRNLVAIYRSQKGVDMQYYPVIDSVVDSFGNKPGYGILGSGIFRLKVGDHVAFTCRATDPQGRTLRWELKALQNLARDSVEEAAVATGTDVVLNWTVNKRQVGEQAIASIELTSDGEFHRLGTLDERVQFYYAVDPPD